MAGHHMMHEMDVVTKVAGKLLEMQQSQYFEQGSILRRELKVRKRTEQLVRKSHYRCGNLFNHACPVYRRNLFALIKIVLLNALI